MVGRVEFRGICFPVRPFGPIGRVCGDYFFAHYRGGNRPPIPFQSDTMKSERATEKW